MQLWNDEEMLNYVETRLGLMTSNIQDNRRERMASLLRCGMLHVFSCISVGEEPTKDKTPNLGDSADIVWDEDDRTRPFRAKCARFGL